MKYTTSTVYFILGENMSEIHKKIIDFSIGKSIDLFNTFQLEHVFLEKEISEMRRYLGVMLGIMITISTVIVISFILSCFFAFTGSHWMYLSITPPIIITLYSTYIKWKYMKEFNIN